jgi:hypothetical protein
MDINQSYRMISHENLRQRRPRARLRRVPDVCRRVRRGFDWLGDVMDKRTAGALEASIRHWEENVAAETPHDAGVWSDSCALCSEFLKENDDSYIVRCFGCPVYQRTGHHECSRSPYGAARNAWEHWVSESEVPEARDDFRRRAQAELDFLVSLRDAT